MTAVEILHTVYGIVNFLIVQIYKGRVNSLETEQCIVMGFIFVFDRWGSIQIHISQTHVYINTNIRDDMYGGLIMQQRGVNIKSCLSLFENILVPKMHCETIVTLNASNAHTFIPGTRRSLQIPPQLLTFRLWAWKTQAHDRNRRCFGMTIFVPLQQLITATADWATPLQNVKGNCAEMYLSNRSISFILG